MDAMSPYSAGLQRILDRAAEIATEHGRDEVLEQDVLAAMVPAGGPSWLAVFWPQEGAPPYRYDATLAPLPFPVPGQPPYRPIGFEEFAALVATMPPTAEDLAAFARRAREA